MDLTDRFKDQFIKMVREYAVAIGRDYDQYYEPNFNNLAKLSESDLAQFFRSIDNQCVAVPGDGHLYVGGTRERIFDHGVKTRKPRYAKVCIEPVLSQGAIARLMFVNRHAKLPPIGVQNCPPYAASRSGPEPTELITKWRRVRP